MYAIIEVGAKQYTVKIDDVIAVVRQKSDIGKDLSIKKVLMVSDGKDVSIGEPYLKNAQVKAQVMGHFRGEKTIAYKYRRRKSSHTKKGHRDDLTRLKIKGIEVA